MTPIEKASKLTSYYLPFCNDNITDAKYCALIAVDEILETTKVKWATQRKFPNGEYKFWKGVAYKKYWIEVKKEIEAL